MPPVDGARVDDHGPVVGDRVGREHPPALVEARIADRRLHDARHRDVVADDGGDRLVLVDGLPDGAHGEVDEHRLARDGAVVAHGSSERRGLRGRCDLRGQREPEEAGDAFAMGGGEGDDGADEEREQRERILAAGERLGDLAQRRRSREDRAVIVARREQGGPRAIGGLSSKWRRSMPFSRDRRRISAKATERSGRRRRRRRARAGDRSRRAAPTAPARGARTTSPS